MKIIHTTDHFLNEKNHERVMAAMKTWDAWPVQLHSPSRRFGSRGLAYLKDVISQPFSLSKGVEAVVYTNNDISLTPEAKSQVERALRKNGRCYSKRVDVRKIHHERLNISTIWKYGSQYPGADLFAATREWWKWAVDDHLPDFVIGAEGWDFVLKALMDSKDGLGISIPDAYEQGFAEIQEVIYHVAHPAAWSRPENLLTSDSQIHNRSLAIDWAERYGFEDYINDRNGYLFK